MAYISCSTSTVVGSECPLGKLREQHNESSFNRTDTRAVNSHNDNSISDHSDHVNQTETRGTVNDVGYAENVQLATQHASEINSGTLTTIRAEANILNDASHNWDGNSGAVTSIGQVDNTQNLTGNTTMHCSCNRYTYVFNQSDLMPLREGRTFVSETPGGSSSFALVHPLCPCHISPHLMGTYADSHGVLTSSPNQDLSRNNVRTETFSTEDSADAALSRRNDENPVIPPNCYIEYAPRTPSHSARAYPFKGNEPHSHLSSKPLPISKNCPAAACVMIFRDFNRSFIFATLLYFLYRVFEKVYERVFLRS